MAMGFQKQSDMLSRQSNILFIFTTAMALFVSLPNTYHWPRALVSLCPSIL